MIDLYSVPTGNGQKVHIMLEECGLAYTPHLVDLKGGAHRQADFLRMNPNSRVPVIVDHDAGGFAVSESSAILTYLAEKSGKFMPTDLKGRTIVQQWLSAVASNMGPLFRGVFVFSHVVQGKHDETINYFKGEIDKAYAMLDKELATRPYLAGDEYTIADISAFPNVVTTAFMSPRGIDPYPNLQKWAAKIGERPAVQRGLKLFK